MVALLWCVIWQLRLPAYASTSIGAEGIWANPYWGWYCVQWSFRCGWSLLGAWLLDCVKTAPFELKDWPWCFHVINKGVRIALQEQRSKIKIVYCRSIIGLFHTLNGAFSCSIREAISCVKPDNYIQYHPSGRPKVLIDRSLRASACRLLYHQQLKKTHTNAEWYLNGLGIFFYQVLRCRTQLLMVVVAVVHIPTIQLY
jgi:hypothetical protein